MAMSDHTFQLIEGILASRKLIADRCESPEQLVFTLSEGRKGVGAKGVPKFTLDPS